LFDFDVFLENLKILAKAESIAELSKKTDMKRNLINNLGVTFKARDVR
jgi:hypothetical protein